MLLDIGAGGSSFVRAFRKLNPHIAAMYLCGEPRYSGSWNGVVKRGKIQKIRAAYGGFNLPDQSLDFVTLNAPHPLTPTTGLVGEVLRCLKKGGLFFSAHPVGFHPSDMPLSLLWSCRFENISRWFRTRFVANLMSVDRVHVQYPPSPIVLSRLEYLSIPPPYRARRAAYIYEDRDGGPSIRVWMKE